jgi:serine/threonine-protein phosphatase 4 regulatory subunit 1
VRRAFIENQKKKRNFFQRSNSKKKKKINGRMADLSSLIGYELEDDDDDEQVADDNKDDIDIEEKIVIGQGSDESDDDSDDFLDNDEDAKLSRLERLQKYAKSDDVMKKVSIAKEVSVIVLQREISSTTLLFDCYFPLVVDLARDDETLVRELVAQQLHVIGTQLVCQDSTSLAPVLDAVVPIFDLLSIDASERVRVLASTGLARLCSTLLSVSTRRCLVRKQNINVGADDGALASSSSSSSSRRLSAATLLAPLTLLSSSDEDEQALLFGDNNDDDDDDDDDDSIGMDDVNREALLRRFVVPIVERLAADELEEAHRAQALHLIGKAARAFGASLCDEVALPVVEWLADDKLLSVRKAAAACLTPLALVLLNGSESESESGPAAVDRRCQRLLALLEKFRDDGLWEVRRSAAKAVPTLAAASTADERRGVLLTAFLTLAKDESRWVQDACMKRLGRFIVSFRGDEASVPHRLLELFTSMAANASGVSLISDQDGIVYSSYNLPAVLWTIGGARWIEVRQVFVELAKDFRFHARRTLAHSLHELAALVGPENAAADLVPAFDAFLGDMDEVKSGAVRHMAAFLRHVPDAERERLLPVVDELHADARNWRYRQMIAEQLDALAPIVDADKLVALTLASCSDAAAAVRRVGIGQLPRVYAAVGDEQRRTLIDSLVALRTGNFARRQSFLMSAASMRQCIEPQKFAPLIVELAADPIPNVRLLVAQLLVDLLSLDRFAEWRDRFADALSTLAADSDVDVASIASQQQQTQ